jgi:hypothetical protein
VLPRGARLGQARSVRCRPKEEEWKREKKEGKNERKKRKKRKRKEKEGEKGFRIRRNPRKIRREGILRGFLVSGVSVISGRQ